jgi:hypothetical protein
MLYIKIMDFLKKLYSKKTLLISIFAFVFLFYASPVLAFWQELKNAMLSIPFLLPGVFIGILVIIANSFAWVAGALLNWVTSPAFISLSYTQPGLGPPPENPIIYIGLNITKNFVNLSLVVVLIFIAFAITLRLKEYATQKTLVRLIIIALLVNFAPIFVGLIVDAANIVMNYFLIGIQEGVSGMLNNITSDSLVNDLGKLTFGSLTAKSAFYFSFPIHCHLDFSYLVSFSFCGLDSSSH